MDCKVKIINKKQIDKIKYLWQKLNEIHLRDSHFFKDHYKTFTFEERCKKFNKIEDSNLRIEIIEDGIKTVGYCISTVENGVGEIDSLFIDEDYRKHGYGLLLIKNSIRWLKNKNCNKIMVSVAEGHESVFEFYKKLGFYPRLTYLQLK